MFTDDDTEAPSPLTQREIFEQPKVKAKPDITRKGIMDLGVLSVKLVREHDLPTPHPWVAIGTTIVEDQPLYGTGNTKQEALNNLHTAAQVTQQWQPHMLKSDESLPEELKAKLEISEDHKQMMARLGNPAEIVGESVAVPTKRPTKKTSTRSSGTKKKTSARKR